MGLLRFFIPIMGAIIVGILLTYFEYSKEHTAILMILTLAFLGVVHDLEEIKEEVKKR